MNSKMSENLLKNNGFIKVLVTLEGKSSKQKWINPNTKKVVVISAENNYKVQGM